MSDQPSISVEDCTIFLKTLSFDAEPGLALEIVDRWRDGDRVNVRMRHPKSRACGRFSVQQAFSSAGRRYLVLHTWRTQFTGGADILVALPDPNHAATLVPEEYRELSKQVACMPVNDDFGRLAEYLGEIPDLTEQIRSREEFLSRDLTAEICLPCEPVSPGSLFTIAGKRQHEGCVFLTLRAAGGESHTDPLLLEFLARTNRPAVSTQDFRLHWIAEVHKDTFVVLSYPPELVADSDERPLMVLRLVDERTMAVLTPMEFAEVRLILIDWLSVRDETRATEADEYLGFIPAPHGRSA
ncbi:MAG: hypothetical protein AB1714_04750 [Acidobacteriota bacterium]